MNTTPYDPSVYWSNRLAEDGGLEAVGWQGLGAAYNGWLYRQRRRVFLRALGDAGQRQPAPRVLELAPGNGFYVALWRRLGVRELSAVEIAAPAVERLRQRFPSYQFLTGDIGTRLALPTGSFDVVTALDVLFHITDDAAFDQAIANIARALRPGGVALISDLFPEETPVERPHQRSRSAAVYRERLTAHGLRLERRRPVFVLMHPWAAPRSQRAERIARAWWWLVERTAGHLPGGGAVLGALLAMADALLTRLVKNGPSTQLWTVRREG